MSPFRLATRGLRFYWRTHLAVAAAVAVACAVLTGALAIGDSVRGTLAYRLEERLGQIHWAMVSPDRFFRADLAKELANDVGMPVVPMIQVRGLVSNQDGTHRINAVQVLGVDNRFFEIGPGQSMSKLQDWGQEGVFLNRALAERLAVTKGDAVVLRIDRPQWLSGDMPLAPDSNRIVAARLMVRGLLGPGQFGDFRLTAAPGAALNVFVPLGWLQQQLGRGGLANGLVVAGEAAGPQLTEAIRRSWRLADAGLELRTVRAQAIIELSSPRVFLDGPVAEAAMAAGDRAAGVLTYLVNRLQVGDKATPYSMVAAISPAGPYRDLFPADMNDNGVVINPWLAEDLGAKVGDEIELAYYVSGPARQLEEKTSRLRVGRIVAMESLAADPNLMPEFPGLSDAASCRDWDPGIAIDLKQIRPKDEDYWDRYKGTPKAFVTLAAGRAMWANRFGGLTAVRWPVQDNSESDLSASILAKIEPSAIGLSFYPVRQQGQKAATEGTDFGPLFLGLSMFLIGAAVVLIGLLFVFGIEARASQIGTLLALGLERARVRRLLLWEGGVVAAIGTLTGTFLGLVYTRALISGLSTIWKGAVASEPIQFHVRASTLVSGSGIGLVTALAVMALTLRRQVRRTAHQLLTGTGEGLGVKGPSMRRIVLGLGVSGLAIAGAVLLVLVFGIKNSEDVAAGFFGAGSLLLIGCLVWAGTALAILRLLGQGMGLTPVRLAIRNAARRPDRSQAVMAMLACGVFMVIAVGANRQTGQVDLMDRRSGTGGFGLYGQTTVPVLQDLKAPAGRKAMGLDDAALAGVDLVQIRVYEADDASCLNLNRAQRPSLLGIDPNRLKDRFSFRESLTSDLRPPISDPWSLLEKDLGPDLVPAVGDYATVIWGLGRSIGDRIEYTDEKGRPFSVQIVGVLENSVFQGNLLVSERAFIDRFPSKVGYGLFLADLPTDKISSLSAYLSSRLEDYGMSIETTGDRLSTFNQVEATYLAIFLVLGGLGLVLGTVGLALVVLRNLLERRGEWAMMRAVGFDRELLTRLACGEHWSLLVAGLIIGTGSAIIAIGPVIKSGSGQLPVGELLVTLTAIAISGAVWVVLAARVALRGPIWDALRNE